MEREVAEIDGEGLDRPGTVVRYGHWGRPVLVFPSQSGRAWDYESNGMVDAVSDLIEAGRIKLYAVDSFDSQSWSQYSLPTEDRARRHAPYENWILHHVVPAIDRDSPGHQGIVTTGCSMGAYHAVNFTLKRADLFPVAIGLSGNYDPTCWRGWGELGEATYFNNPTAYVPQLHGLHLDWLRRTAQVVLVAGQGPFEEQPTRSLPGTRTLAQLLADKDLPHQLDIWGHDCAHDWPWWRRQIAQHLPRFC